MGRAIQRSHSDSYRGLQTSAGRLSARPRFLRRGVTQCPTGRQLNLPSIGEFEIVQVHVAASTFDDVARTDRKAAGKTTDPGTTEPRDHGPILLSTGPPITSKLAPERDGSETPLCEPQNLCG